MVSAKDIMKTDFAKVDVNDTAAEFLGQLRVKKQTFAVVFDGKNYKGLVDRKWLLTSRIDTSKTRLRNITKKASKRGTPFFVPKLDADADLAEMCRLLAAAGTRALPVFEKEKLVGVVTARSVMRQIKSEYAGIPVSELASTGLAVIGPAGTIADAIKTMNKSGVDRLPVVDKLGRIAGIVTEFDILKRFHRFPTTARKLPSSRSHADWSSPAGSADEKQNLLKLPVENIMTPYPMVCCASMRSTIAEVLDVLIKEDVNSVILIDNDKPAGIITVKDILDDYTRG